jgi:hypothetical protein
METIEIVGDEGSGEVVYDDTHEVDPYYEQDRGDSNGGIELQGLSNNGRMYSNEGNPIPTLLNNNGQHSVILEEDDEEETEGGEGGGGGSDGTNVPQISENVKQIMSDKVQAMRGRAWSAAPAPQGGSNPPLPVGDVMNRTRRSSTSSSMRSSRDNENVTTRLRSGSSNADENRGRSRTNSGSNARESSDVQMLRSNTPRSGGAGNTSFHDREVRGFGHQKGHSNNAFGLQASSHRVRANESNFKQTASALHVLARRTDKTAFDKVDKELGEALQSGVGALSGSGENSEVMNRVHNQRAGMGAGRRSVISMVTGDTDTFDTGRRHISMKTVGMMALASTRNHAKDGQQQHHQHQPGYHHQNSQDTPTSSHHKTAPPPTTSHHHPSGLAPPTPQNDSHSPTSSSASALFPSVTPNNDDQPTGKGTISLEGDGNTAI